MFVRLFLLPCFFFGHSHGNEDAVQQGFDYEGPIVITAEARLHEDIFIGGKRKTFPSLHDTLNLTFGITLLSVIDFEAANEVIVLNAFIRQKWNNPSTTWDPTMYGNISKINVYPDLTWIPDIYGYANVEEGLSYNGMLDKFKTNIIVSYDGNHSWLAPVTFKHGCTMDVRDIPFDTQVCSLTFGSFTYSANRLMMYPEKVDLSKYSESSEWILVSMDAKQKLVDNADLTIHSDVEYSITLKRKPLYFLLNLVAPNIIISSLTIMVFVLPTTAGERTGYVLTLILALAFFIVSAGENLPSSSEAIPLFQYFLLTTLTMMAILCICLCYSTACYYANSNVIQLPLWMRNNIIGKLSNYFDINIKRKYPKWRLNLDAIKGLQYERLNEESKVSTENVPGKLWSTNTATNVNDLINILGGKCVHDAHLKLDAILQQYENEDDSTWCKREWEIITLTLDRLFFCIFTFVLLTTIFSCLVHITCIK